MKSSLKLSVVFELLEGVVGFEYIHSSFPEQKCSPEYTIFSKMKSYLKWSLLWNSWSSSNSSKAWLALNTFTLYLHFLIENILQSSQSSLKWSLLWNKVFSETLGRLWTVRSTGLQLSGSTWIFFVFQLFELFEGVVVGHSLRENNRIEG